jgi:alpha-1,6-mannosyltransferase
VRIVQVANFVTPTSGELRRTLEALGPRYVSAGHRCSLVHPAAERESATCGGVRVERIPGVVLPMSGGYRVIARRSQLKGILAAERPDLVELSDKTTLSWLPEWLRRRGVPTALLAHDRHDAVLDGALPGTWPWRALVGARSARAARPSAAVVCASAFCAEQFAGSGVPVRRIPLGVDLDVFHPRRSPGAWMLGEASVTLAFVGRLSPEKRPGLAIAAVRHLVAGGADVLLRVVGDGPLRGALEAQAIGLPVRFAGHLEDRSSVATILAGARVLVAPCGTETFGLALLESLACGTPVIVPPDGAARELVVPGTGIVVEPEAAPIAGAVLEIVGGDAAAQRRRCRSHAERFTWDATAAAMLELFDEVLDESNSNLRSPAHVVSPLASSRGSVGGGRVGRQRTE